MSQRDLKIMLETIEDTREVVLRVASGADAPYAMWSAAQADVDAAYAAWRHARTREAHAVYAAALDREAAAAATLAQAR